MLGFVSLIAVFDRSVSACSVRVCGRLCAQLGVSTISWTMLAAYRRLQKKRSLFSGTLKICAAVNNKRDTPQGAGFTPPLPFPARKASVTDGLAGPALPQFQNQISRSKRSAGRWWWRWRSPASPRCAGLRVRRCRWQSSNKT